MKGGHLESSGIIDQLFTKDDSVIFKGERIETKDTHGTGCALASACAVGIAQGLTISDTVQRAQAYVFEAIRTAPGYGSGHGPLNHGHTLREN